jgi:lysine biosynthesis protein LysW
VHVDTDVDKGEIVECEECGLQLEIVGLDPVDWISSKKRTDDDEDEDEY